MRRDVLDRLKHKAKIGVPIATPHGRAHGEKYQIGFRDRAAKIGRELNPSIAKIAL